MEIESENSLPIESTAKNGIDNNKPATVEDKFAKIKNEKFKDIVSRMSFGCGRERCRSNACVSNPCATKAEIEQKAEQLIKTHLDKLEVCSALEKGVTISLQKKELQQILSQSDEIAVEKQLNSRIEQVFSDQDALMTSFFTDCDVHQQFNKETCNIDFDAIRMLVRYIQAIKTPTKAKIIQDIISAAFIGHLGKIEFYREHQSFFRCLEDYRVLILLLILQPIYGQDLSLFQKVKRPFMFLSNEQSEILAHWLVPLDKSELEVLKQTLQTGVIVWLLESSLALGSRIMDLEAGMNVLKVIYLSNRLNNRINRESFVLSIFEQGSEERMNPVHEYTSWLKGRSNKNPDKRFFSFCNYPFSMTLAFKYEVLETNSKFEQKNQHEKMLRNFVNQGLFFIQQAQLYLTFEVTRDNILQDTLDAVSAPGINFLLPFKVKFKGEQGIDEGGVRKEYYQIMIKQLFNPDFGLFKEKQNKQFNWFNGTSIEMPMLYELIGALMGIAIYNQIQMDVRFPTVIYKKLIGDSVSLEDIKQFDSSTYNGLSFILSYEGDIENDLQETFSIEYESFGQTISYELKPGGDSINVTNENKQEYVDLYVDWLLNKSIERQFNNFKRGFFKVLDTEIIKFFTYDELVLILTGLEEIDFSELKKSTKYDQGYTEDSPQVKWLWELLNDFTLEQRKRFIFFCTGSDRAPVTGFRSLNFIVARHGDSDRQLPSAHTCFNHLLLPAYSSKQVLQQKLMLSLENAEGFGLF